METSDFETELAQASFQSTLKLKLLLKVFRSSIFAGNSERRPWRVVQENESQQIPVDERSYHKTLARLEVSCKAT